MKRLLLGITVVLFGGAIASSHLSDDILTLCRMGNSIGRFSHFLNRILYERK